MKLTQLVYVSTARVPFTTPQLLALLDQSRRNNSRNELTGLLLFREGNFMQALEGPEAAVQQTFDRISVDRRHGNLITIFKTEVRQRDFEQWEMGFRDLSDPSLADHPGFSEFMNLAVNDESIVTDLSKARRLLSVFQQTMR